MHLHGSSCYCVLQQRTDVGVNTSSSVVNGYVLRLNEDHHVLQIEIEQLHKQVTEQVKTLYHDHRHLHGWQNQELEIV